MRRNKQWELLYKREAKALEGTIREKRSKGTHQVTSDPFGHMRQKLMDARQAAYGAQTAPPKSQPAPPKPQQSKRKRPSKSQRKKRSAVSEEDGDVLLPNAS